MESREKLPADASFTMELALTGLALFLLLLCTYLGWPVVKVVNVALSAFWLSSKVGSGYATGLAGTPSEYLR